MDKKSWQVLGNAAPKGLIKMIGECACILWGKDPGQWSNAQFLFNASEKNSKLGDKDGIIAYLEGLQDWGHWWQH